MNEIIERLRKLSESLRQTQAFDNLNQLDKDIDEIEKIFDKATPKKSKTYVSSIGLHSLSLPLLWHFSKK